jgi:uncharacterized protein
MRVPVTGLLGRPGQRKELVQSVPPDSFGDDPWGPAVDELVGPIALDLLLEAVSGGVLVRGTVNATAIASCARCLAPTTRPVAVELLELHRATGGHDDELFEEDDEDLDYELVEGDTQLELDQMVRDALVVGQPVRSLCRADCAGLCPTCGADRNTDPCEHGTEPDGDPRWEALRGLRLPPAVSTAPADDPAGRGSTGE